MGSPAESFVVLTFDGLQLAVPRADVRAVEAATDVTTDATLQGGVGWFNSAGVQRPVFCFDGDLRRVVRPPHARRVCVLLGAPASQGAAPVFGVLCDDFIHLIARTAQWQALPPALAVPGSPLNGLLLLDGAIACTTNAVALARVLPLPAPVSASVAAPVSAPDRAVPAAAEAQ
jgi:hypothetical protein